MPINDGFFSATLFKWFLRRLSSTLGFPRPCFILVVAPTQAWLNPLSYNKPSCSPSHVFELPPDFILHVSRFYHESFLQGSDCRCCGQLVQAEVRVVSVFLLFSDVSTSFYVLVICVLKEVFLLVYWHLTFAGLSCFYSIWSGGYKSPVRRLSAGYLFL